MIVGLYNSIYRVLANDIDVLNYLRVNTTLPEKALKVVKGERIQKTRLPKKLMESLPLITFYALPSGREPGNSLVYNAVFMFDIYTEGQDDELARSIADRLYDLFEDEFLDVTGKSTFKAEWLDGYESPTDDPDTYCFTTIFVFGISPDE